MQKHDESGIVGKRMAVRTAGVPAKTSCRDNVIPDCKLDELSRSFETHLLHGRVFVETILKPTDIRASQRNKSLHRRLYARDRNLFESCQVL
jgi:hypothetical protein